MNKYSHKLFVRKQVTSLVITSHMETFMYQVRVTSRCSSTNVVALLSYSWWLCILLTVC